MQQDSITKTVRRINCKKERPRLRRGLSSLHGEATSAVLFALRIYQRNPVLHSFDAAAKPGVSIAKPLGLDDLLAGASRSVMEVKGLTWTHAVRRGCVKHAVPVSVSEVVDSQTYCWDILG